jgi:hypothetical protein
MNKRIRELHMQAQQEAFSEPIDIENCAVEDIKGFSQQVYEKFAELIAHECIDLALGSSHREDDMGAIIANKIRKHFGVEE